MHFDGADYWNWRYRRLLPKRYQSKSGVSTHSFRVLDPWHRAYPLYRDNDSEEIVDRAAKCGILLNGRLRRLLVQESLAPDLFEALLFLGQTLFAGNRIVRYMSLFKAYEALTDERDGELAAIRHALSHPDRSLTRRSTRERLERMFGSTSVDLSDSRHERVFFMHFGRLLIITDGLIADRVHGRLPDWIRLNAE